jgi:hypothetical protein
MTPSEYRERYIQINCSPVFDLAVFTHQTIGGAGNTITGQNTFSQMIIFAMNPL